MKRCRTCSLFSGDKLASMELWIWSVPIALLLDFERHRASSSDDMGAFKEKGDVDEMALSIVEQ